MNRSKTQLMELISDELNVKIAVLGQTMVGKSALTYRFIKDSFPEIHITTYEEEYSKFTEIEGVNVKIEVLDTAGQDDYQTMFDTWVNNSDCFLLVYSIDDADSFKTLKVRHQRILKLKNASKTVIQVVGNKCDLEAQRKVSTEEVENYCREQNVYFTEASALKSINVKEAFLNAAKNMIKIKYPNKFKTKSDAKRCFCF